ncbi:MAG TPA: hypothetical protein PLJ08_19965 [Cyclobacteriaceae bacterium]|nr:hypothetical protein [Cyclobacteriaceae bacterium]
MKFNTWPRIVSFSLLTSFLVYAGCSSNDEPKPVDCNTTDLAISLTSKSDPASCNTNNGTIIVSATGGAAPYQFKLNSGTFAAATTFTNLGSGSFTIIVKDANDCEKTLAAVILTAPTSPVAGASTIVHHTNCLDPNGSITVNVTGGTPPYEYKLGSGLFGSSNVFSQLKAGNYTVTVQDDADCSITINNVVNSSTSVSFQTQISAIIQTRCSLTGCHNGDNGASRNWTVLSNVQTNATNIKSRTGARSMPPAGAQQLTQEQIDLIACWVDSGAQNN